MLVPSPAKHKDVDTLFMYSKLYWFTFRWQNNVKITVLGIGKRKKRGSLGEPFLTVSLCLHPPSITHIHKQD